MEEIIINKAIEQKTLSFAESCTGGLIGDRITNVSQCSKAFKGGLVVYSDFSKINILGVDSNRIENLVQLVRKLLCKWQKM